MDKTLLRFKIDLQWLAIMFALPQFGNEGSDETRQIYPPPSLTYYQLLMQHFCL